MISSLGDLIDLHWLAHRSAPKERENALPAECLIPIQDTGSRRAILCFLLSQKLNVQVADLLSALPIIQIDFKPPITLCSLLT